MLAVARAVLEQIPDISLDDLATQLASGLGGKRTDMRQVLLDAGLFAPAIPDGPAPEAVALPRYIVHIDKRKGVQPFVVASTDPPRPVMPFDRLRDAQMVCDGLNLELPIERAVDRAQLLDRLVHGEGGVVRFDRPIARKRSEREAFVCDLIDQRRAWGPFDSIGVADVFRERAARLRVWAVTSHWPFSMYYPPALYGLFGKEHPLRYPNPWLNKPKEAPKRPETDAKDMTPVILEAVRQYMAFQSETNRAYGPCHDAYQRLQALLRAGGAGETVEDPYAA